MPGFNDNAQGFLNEKLATYSLPVTVDGVPNKPAFVLSVFGLNQLRRALLDKQEITTDEEVRRSKLNTPIFKFADIRLSMVLQENNDVFSGSVSSEGQVVEVLLDTALVEISQSKNIIMTPMQGRDGTIKEYISDGDYEIRIRGVIDSGSMHVYPEQEIANFYTILKAKQSITITCPFIQQFNNISEVVVVNYSFFQAPGGYNFQPFEITLLSDTPLELQPTDA